MDSDWERLRILSIKLRSLSHLIEIQSSDVVLPSDEMKFTGVYL